MALVSNLQEIRTVFDKIEDHLNPNSAIIGSRHTYTLQRFVYAFKLFVILIFFIWIFVTFPNSSLLVPLYRMLSFGQLLKGLLCSRVILK
uniref:Uncharacterized protein n=1 Tax=Lactuca sativa TaxID=4236 RepID=A0A9R1W7W9_LACSA|nr:hypothetical protein LSAT_V11C300135430 [Lactuca sativa]